MSTRSPGHTHIGRCTTGPLFTREDAEVVLTAAGFTWNAERVDWERGDERGRLCWQPDYCNPNDTKHGTVWFLTRPHNEGTIPVLPQD